MKNRLRQVRDHSGMTVQAFANYLGVSKSTIESYEYGRRRPSAAFLTLVSDRLGVSKGWLETGFGQPFPNAPDRFLTIGSAIKEARPGMPDSFVQHIADAMSKLDSDDWMFLAELAQDMAAKAEEIKKSAPDESEADNTLHYESIAKSGVSTPFDVSERQADALNEKAIQFDAEERKEPEDSDL